MRVTLLSGKYDKSPVGYCDFKDLAAQMLYDPALLELGAEMEQMSLSGDTDGYEKAKGRLPAFIIGEFSEREDDKCILFEPFVCFDIDHVNPDIFDGTFRTLQGWEHTVLVYPSPSRKGFRLLCHLECNEDTRYPMYLAAAEKLSDYSGIPLEQDLTPAQRKTLLVINTSTHNLSRLWYYTGVRPEDFRVNQEYHIFQKPVQVQQAEAPELASGASEEQKVEALVCAVERAGVDLTADYDSWMRCGMALASTFGEGGRNWFHRLSAAHGDYDSRKADLKYDNLVKTSRGSISIATLFKFAKDAGVTVIHEHRQYDHLSPGAKYEDLDLERTVIEFCLSSEGAFQQLKDEVPNLMAACFRDTFNRAVFEACSYLDSKGLAIGISTVKGRLKTDMLEFMGSFEPARHSVDIAASSAKMVFDLYCRSELQVVLAKAAAEVMDDARGLGEHVAAVVRSCSDVGSAILSGDDSVKSALVEFRENREELLAKLLNDTDAISGVTTGIPSEDAFCSGRHPGDLVIIAARPGMGKTAKMLTEARCAAKSGKPVGIITLEMSRADVVKRMLCQESGISNKKMRNPLKINHENGEAGRLQSAEELIGTLPIHISKECTTPDTIVAQCRKWVRKEGVEAIYIDYLGLVTLPNKKNRTEELGNVTRALKLAAQELKIPIVLLHQLSRETEKSKDKRPSLVDLRDSGRIEEDADIVIFIYRQAYYSGSGSNTTELIYAKHRDGELRSVMCSFVGDIFLFKEEEDTDPSYFPPPNPLAGLDAPPPSGNHLF